MVPSALTAVPTADTLPPCRSRKATIASLLVTIILPALFVCWQDAAASSSRFLLGCFPVIFYFSEALNIRGASLIVAERLFVGKVPNCYCTSDPLAGETFGPRKIAVRAALSAIVFGEVTLKARGSAHKSPLRKRSRSMGASHPGRKRTRPRMVPKRAFTIAIFSGCRLFAGHGPAQRQESRATPPGSSPAPAENPPIRPGDRARVSPCRLPGGRSDPGRTNTPKACRAGAGIPPSPN